MIEGSEEHVRQLRAAAVMAAEAAEIAIGRVMIAEAVVDAARAYIDAIALGANEDEIAVRVHDLVMSLQNYDGKRPS